MTMKTLDIEEYLFRRHRDKLYLQSIQLDLTNVCNANCMFCLQGSHTCSDNELTFDEICKILKDARELHAFNVGFDGGEAFARSDFHKILKYASDLGYSISIATNGQLLSEDDILLIKNCSVSKVSVSFHSIDKKTYNQLFGVKGNEYEIALKNIERLLHYGVRTGIAITITRLNLDDLLSTIEYFRHMGISVHDIGLNHLIAGKKDINNLCISREQKIDLARQLYNLGIDTCIRGHYLCKAGRTALSVSYNGMVYACPLLQTPAGNIRKNTLKEIWEESEYFKMLRSLTPSHFPKCEGCEAKYECQMCLRNNIVYNDNIFLPFEDTCAYMKARKELKDGKNNG